MHCATLILRVMQFAVQEQRLVGPHIDVKAPKSELPPVFSWCDAIVFPKLASWLQSVPPPEEAPDPDLPM